MLVVMAKGGKNSSRKGKLNCSKPETSSTKTEVSQSSNIHADGPRNPSDLNSEAELNLALSASESSYTLNELEQFLYLKLELLYSKIEDKLLKLEYSRAEVEKAILHAGFIHGQLDIFNNTCQNAIAYIEKKAEPRTEGFTDLVELYRFTFETMVESVMEIKKNTRRAAVWDLLVKNWGFIPSTDTISQQRSTDKSSIWYSGSFDTSSLSRNEDTSAADPSSADKTPHGIQFGSSSKKVGLLERVNLTPSLLSHLRMNCPIVRAFIKRKIEDPLIRLQAFPFVTGKPTEVPNIVSSDFLRSLTEFSYGKCLIGCLESNSDEPKTTLIVDLVKATRELHEKVKEQKEWAKKKVIDSAKRLSKDLLELKMLKMEEFDLELNKQEIIFAQKTCILMLMETEHGLRKVNAEKIFISDTVKRLERINAQMRVDIEASKLDEYEYEKEFEEVMHRERRCMRKLTDVEKQTCIFQSQFEEEQKRAVQLEMELHQAEREVFQVEMQWRRETTEKEQMRNLLAEEKKNLEIRKANSKSHLLKLQQKVDTDSQLGKDDIQRLESDLSRLRLSTQMPETFLEDAAFWCDDVESSLLGSAALVASSEETIRHWICMMCSRNEVSVLLLPCTHQVLCSPCYSENFEMAGGRCPYCHVKIEQSFKVYGMRY